MVDTEAWPSATLAPAREPEPDPETTLDALVPGLCDALVDLLDALNDRTDELGPGRPDLLVRLADRLTATWPDAVPAEQPLILLDALRSVLKPSPR